MRLTLGDEIELLHDVHERVSPDQALSLCKELEQYKPLFIEDPLPPEQIGYFKHIRANTTTPIAIDRVAGEQIDELTQSDVSGSIILRLSFFKRDYGWDRTST